jgi:hypothetical protein
MRQWHGIAAAGVLGLAGCASTRATPPRPLSNVPHFRYASLRRTPIAVAIEDVRGDQDESGELKERLRSDLSIALSSASVPVSPDAPITLRIRIVRYGANFALAEWKGCVAFESRFIGANSEQPLVPVERCVSRFNALGAATADDVLSDAYGEAVAEFLRRLDDAPALGNTQQL